METLKMFVGFRNRRRVVGVSHHSNRVLRTASAAVVLVLLVAAGGPVHAQTFTTLFTFDGFNGADAYASLIQGTDGNFYGTTYQGGIDCCGVVAGTAFKVSSEGGLDLLASFYNGYGAGPYAPLVQGADGNFYGTTSSGGENGWGTVFKVTPEAALTTIYNFCAQASCADGAAPSGGMVLVNGAFYGTTGAGGIYSGGTVFKITSEGTLTTIYNFCRQADCIDGEGPRAGLLQGSNGDLYGTTYAGGADTTYSTGTVFKITPSGTLTTLYSFCRQTPCDDGENPVAALVEGPGGDFYGSTYKGGANSYGTVFKITPGGALTTLHTFCAQTGCTDGADPYGALVAATDGNLYGTTVGGGAHGWGTIFKITAGGVLTTLYSFCSQTNCAYGGDPYGGLLQATDGSFYGTTSTQVPDISGTIFSLDMGLGPFVETQPSSGKVGANIIILGTNLTGSTSVTFNGTAATFTVVSDSEITTTVPTGATTGEVEVTTPGGTLKSNVIFRVKA